MGQATPADKLRNLATNYFDTNATTTAAVVDLATTSLAATGAFIYQELNGNGATAGVGQLTAAVAPSGGYAQPGALVALAISDTPASGDQFTLTVPQAGWKAQGISATTVAITDATTTVSLTAGTGALFPSSGTVIIDGFSVTYSGKSTDDLTGCDCSEIVNGAAIGTRVVAAPVSGTMLFDGAGYESTAGNGVIMRWNGQSWDLVQSHGVAPQLS
jgi:hypothetical protein